MEIAIPEYYNYVQVNFGSLPSMEFTKSSKHQHINVVFLFFFSTLDSIVIDFKDAKRHKTCIIHGFKLFE